MRVAGVDEAGRGSAIGPLVVAGVAFPEDMLEVLSDLGVKDSKELTAKKRESLAKEIESISSGVRYFELQPRSIDAVVTRGLKLKKLNYLEAVAMACVIRELAPEKAYVDASDVMPERFRMHIEEKLPFRIKIISEHKADFKYPVV